MSFNGTLLLLGGENFPLNYIFADSYKVAPNRRLDLDSTRTADGVLERNVLDHTASTITFEVKPMDNISAGYMWRYIWEHCLNEREKRFRITYYCPELDDYKTGEFYMPDVEIPIYMVDVPNKVITYNKYTLEFIEY